MRRLESRGIISCPGGGGGGGTSSLTSPSHFPSFKGNYSSWKFSHMNIYNNNNPGQKISTRRCYKRKGTVRTNFFCRAPERERERETSMPPHVRRIVVARCILRGKNETRTREKQRSIMELGKPGRKKI